MTVAISHVRAVFAVRVSRVGFAVDAPVVRIKYEPGLRRAWNRAQQSTAGREKLQGMAVQKTLRDFRPGLRRRSGRRYSDIAQNFIAVTVGCFLVDGGPGKVKEVFL